MSQEDVGQISQLGESCRLRLLRGDLTRWAGDAIVNAANRLLLGGGGVDGAIHRAAGPALKAACAELEELTPGVRCPTGEARITPAFGALRCRFVIHTVGPVYQSPSVSAPLLRGAYGSSLALANRKGLETVAFPAISCGVYGYPLEEAATLALDACQTHAGRLSEISFVLFDQRAWAAWIAADQRRLKRG